MNKMRLVKLLTVACFAVFAQAALADASKAHKESDNEFIGYLYKAKKALDLYSELSVLETKLTVRCCDGPAPYYDCGGVPQQKIDRCSVLSKQQILLDFDTTVRRESRKYDEFLKNAGSLVKDGSVSKDAIKKGANILKSMDMCNWREGTQLICKSGGIDF